MPRSVVRKPIPVTTAELQLDNVRRSLLGMIREYTVTGPTHASTCYVWPSSECPVGCQHCNYASPTSIRSLDRYSVAEHGQQLLQTVNGMGLWKAVLSGGGEPMVEPAFCAEFFAGVRSPSLEELELITAAHFASSVDAARASLEPLVAAWDSRPDRSTTQFRVRISLDWFHAQQIGVAPAANVIRALGEPDLCEADVYIRSVLLSGDDTTAMLADELGARRRPVDDYREELILSDGRSVLVYYKNLIVDGRLTHTKLERLPVGVPVASRYDQFGERFRRSDGRQVPARTYNGPEVRHLDGLACLIEDDGRIRILEGNDLTISPTVAEVSGWDDAIARLYRDPITVFLVDEGPSALAELMAGHYPDSVRFEQETNQLYHLSEMLLSTSDRRLTAMLLILERDLERGVVAIDDRAAISAAWAAVEPFVGRSLP
jgi:hypothetical protein